MSIAALFVITLNWKHFQCLLTSKWINRLWHSQTVEYYHWAIKKNELSIDNVTQVNLNIISQVKEDRQKKYILYDSIDMKFQNGKLI